MDQSKKDDFIACSSRGDLKKVSEMIFKGMDIEATNYLCDTALFAATRWGHSDLVEFLIMAGANVKGNEKTLLPLSSASKEGHSGVVELLLRNKANVNATRYSEFTSLMSAVNGCLLYARSDQDFEDYEKTINHLMAAKADPFRTAMIDYKVCTAREIAKLENRNRGISSVKREVLHRKLEDYEKSIKEEMDAAMAAVMESNVTFEIDADSDAATAGLVKKKITKDK